MGVIQPDFWLYEYYVNNYAVKNNLDDAAPITRGKSFLSETISLTKPSIEGK